LIHRSIWVFINIKFLLGFNFLKHVPVVRASPLVRRKKKDDPLREFDYRYIYMVYVRYMAPLGHYCNFGD